MIITNVEGLRDPFVLVDDGVYYLYGTGVSNEDWDRTVWDCYVNNSGTLTGNWTKVQNRIYQKPLNAQKQFWAPEVHKYKGAYYMLASYFSSKTGHRGTSILKAPSPTGPFIEISNGQITPHHIDAIDGTFYVDEDGQPWLVFVHEWTCTEDHIGRMAAAKLSNDLTHLISEPVELFRADSPSWTNNRVTDGCFLRKLAGGELIMLWSNFEDSNYVVGLARSKNGRPDGTWTQDDSLLYRKGYADNHYDGGHGMVFEDSDGQLYLCIHSPNKPCAECKEQAVFIPVEEGNGILSIK